MANANQVLRVENEKETIQKLIETYTDDDLRTILSNPQSSVEFCGRLMRICKEQFDPNAPELQKLWDAAKSVSNFGRLEHFIDMLKPIRDGLLKSLEANANYIEQYAKFGLYMKIMGSVGDIAGTVGDFFLGNSNCDYSNWAFTADVLGFCGDVAPMGEAYLSYNAYNDTVKKIQKDQDRYAPIFKWFQQTRELGEAMQNIFPFDYKESYLSLLYQAADTELRGAKLLAKLLKNIITNNIERLRDGRFVENLTYLVSSNLIEELIEWLKFQSKEIRCNILRMDGRLTIDSFLKLGCRQVASRLPSKHQRSYIVLPRIGWNIWSIFQAFRDLRMTELSEVAVEMRQIKKHLSKEMGELERITGYMHKKRNEQIH